MARTRHGFTLIELLIVITVISILMLVIIPRINQATIRARESTLRDNLQYLRTAISTFENDTGGLPTALSQLTLTPAQALSSLPPQDANGYIITASNYHGPYMVPNVIPTDPVTGVAAWNYDPPTGNISSLATGLALDGSAYASW